MIKFLSIRFRNNYSSISFSEAIHDHHGLFVWTSSPVSASIWVVISFSDLNIPKSLNLFFTFAS